MSELPNVQDMTDAEYRAAKIDLLRRQPAPVLVIGKHVSTMTMAEVMAAEAAMGLRRSHTELRRQRAAVEAERTQRNRT